MFRPGGTTQDGAEVCSAQNVFDILSYIRHKIFLPVSFIHNTCATPPEFLELGGLETSGRIAFSWYYKTKRIALLYSITTILLNKIFVCIFCLFGMFDTFEHFPELLSLLCILWYLWIFCGHPPFETVHIIQFKRIFRSKMRLSSFL